MAFILEALFARVLGILIVFFEPPSSSFVNEFN
jgi:hypothetical protein